MLSDSATRILSITVLCTAAAMLLVWAWVASRRLTHTPIQVLVYAWAYVTARTLWGARISGPLPIPPGQGAVIVCNHCNSNDPAFIGITVNRMVHWMVAKEYYEHPLFGLFLKAVETIPVSRGGVDTAATKIAIRWAQQGGLLGLFPEGRINTSDELLMPGRPGAALIALKARVPVVPCYIRGVPYDGTALGCLFTPAKVRLEVGRPIDISPYYGREGGREVLEELTLRLLSEIAKLAGRPDYKPRLAGRFYKPDPDQE